MLIFAYNGATVCLSYCHNFLPSAQRSLHYQSLILMPTRYQITYRDPETRKRKYYFECPSFNTRPEAEKKITYLEEEQKARVAKGLPRTKDLFKILPFKTTRGNWNF